MKKFKAIFAIVMLGSFMLSSTTTFARNPPNGISNYVKDGHLYVWWDNHYEDMGPFVLGPCPTC
jgi:hypothetical protein